MQNKQFLKLQDLMQGKTVISVESAIGEGGIATFKMSDGNVFRIHATDLGFWIEETANTSGEYTIFNNLLIDMYRHFYSLQFDNKYSTPNPSVVKLDDLLMFEFIDGKIFEFKYKYLSDFSKEILSLPEGIDIFADMVTLGDCCNLVFYLDSCSNNIQDILNKYKQNAKEITL